MSLKVLNRIPVRFKDGKTRWITIKGAHVPVDKDGELKGKTGNKIEKAESKTKPKEKKLVQEPKIFPKAGLNLMENPPSKDTESYLKKADGKASKAVTDYYDNELRGGIVKTTLEVNGKDIPAEVLFDGNGRREFRKFQGNQHDILAVLPYIPEVIANGAYAGRALDKKQHKNQIAFHYKKKTVELDGRTVIVDIGETKNQGYHAYSVNTQGVETFEQKNRMVEKRIEARKKKIGDARLLPSSKDSALFYAQAEALFRFLDSSLPQTNNVLKLSVLAIRVI